MDAVIATARSNKVVTILAMQDFSQLRKDYVWPGASRRHCEHYRQSHRQVIGDTANVLLERFGKIQQEKECISVKEQIPSLAVLLN